MLTRDGMRATFESVGLGRGDHVLVHSSFRSLGGVDGGPGALLDALVATVGADGTIAAPTFNYEIPEPWYDPLDTPSKTGVVAETLRRRPGALRSLHPTHSISALGGRAREFTEAHLDCGACTVGSPVDRIAQAGGYVLLLGVSHTSNTTIHVGEAHAGVRKFPAWDGPAPHARVRLASGALRKYTLDTSSSCSLAFNAIDFELRRSGTIRDFVLGNALSTIMRGRAVIAAARTVLQSNPGILLCTRPGCVRCRRGREYLARQTA